MGLFPVHAEGLAKQYRVWVGEVVTSGLTAGMIWNSVAELVESANWVSNWLGNTAKKFSEFEGLPATTSEILMATILYPL